MTKTRLPLRLPSMREHGWCRHCERWIALTFAGRLYWHGGPIDFSSDGYRSPYCRGTATTPKAVAYPHEIADGAAEKPVREVSDGE